MCLYRVIVCLVTYSVVILSLHECTEVTNDDIVRAADHGDDEDLVSRVLGLPGVWWPASHLVTNAWSLLAAGLSSAVLGASFLPLPQIRRLDQVSERIYRGVVAKPHSWPWIAKLKTTFKRPGAKTRRRACGGALIAERFILTARHCVSWDHSGEVVDGRQVQVWLGSHDHEGQDGHRMSVKRIIIRPDYQQPQCASGLWCPDWAPWGHTTLTNDIAIVELMRSAPIHSPHIAPIKVASFSPPPGTTAWVGGWGLDGHHPTKSLNLAPMALQKDSFRECKQQMSAGKMCVIGKDFGGPCPGDSGSPLVIYNKGLGPQLIGLVSNGAESCKAGLPGIFTRVSHYYDWIHVAMQTARRVGSGLGSNRHRWHSDSHRSWNSFDNHENFHRNHRPSSNAFYTKSKHRPQPMFGRYYNYPNRYY